MKILAEVLSDGNPIVEAFNNFRDAIEATGKFTTNNENGRTKSYTIMTDTSLLNDKQKRSIGDFIGDAEPTILIPKASIYKDNHWVKVNSKEIYGMITLT